ncbi:radical SAM family heme chaperone HemW [Thalassotalea agarivorans]|uniref:Heme chaperone HemW n=1 Tax=Thalassotalea agarivorans TaxID=349064 RepID=A0A1I0HHD1_THASX|nr:radical SAM family heme chaperone HemW [Thalassotalea agarivorans]SET83196.1 coproporphyrinogen III oxidase, anaerobic [Thalassotalea agarivorans]
MLAQQPLSLYIHIPWCVQKCPYCDFNSHALKHDIPEQDYVNELLKDLDSDIARFELTGRTLHTIFIGGGTPSLFSADAMSTLLAQVKTRFNCSEDLEVTLEANPGTVEADKFTGFAKAGVTRLSIGVQSFEGEKLLTLGRIHDSEQAKNAARLAKTCGVKSFNLDLMHGLPNQAIDQALNDLKTAISLNPDHISWYQLTIEPNTAFYSKPPELPQDDVLWDIQQQGVALLAANGYEQYEISAYAKPGKRCQHNINYWRFGDYLGIGCGAHGKITLPEQGKIMRTVKVKHPKGYLDTNREHLDHLTTIAGEELPFEFMMNQLRLCASFTYDDYEKATGLSRQSIEHEIAKAIKLGLISKQDDAMAVTEKGHRYLNDLLTRFL